MVKQEDDTEKESGVSGMVETLGVRRRTDHDEESTDLPTTCRPTGTAREGEVHWGNEPGEVGLVVTAASRP